jgi:hypothetical protein
MSMAYHMQLDIKGCLLNWGPRSHHGLTDDDGKPMSNREATGALQPSGRVYSENVTDVAPLPRWTDGEQCVSCWRMTWRERINALLFGRVWIAVLSGSTQPPVYAERATSNEEVRVSE